MKQVILSRQIVRRLLAYDKKTGTLTWKYRERQWFSSDRSRDSWNSRYSGTLAFTTPSTKNGVYLSGSILNYRLYAHQVIWLWMKNEQLKRPFEIGHKNGVGIDNRWENLMKVTRSQNAHNKHAKQSSRRKCANIYQMPSGNYEIRLRGLGGHLGPFSSLEETVFIRDKFKKKFGYTLLHGTRRT